MKTNLDRMLALLHDGRIDFGAFVAGTRGDFRAMALFLLRRWQAPPWYGPEDVEQELYLGCWERVFDWDPARGVPISRYAVFNAMYRAKRALHSARGARNGGGVHPDRKRSRFDLAASGLGAEDGDGASMIEAMLAELPAAEEALCEREERARAATAALRACGSREERYAVLAIREAGSLDNAAAVLYNDVDHRTALRLGSEEKAERFVRRHASAVARRVASARADADS